MNRRESVDGELENMIREAGQKLVVPEKLRPEMVRQDLLDSHRASGRQRRQARRRGLAAAVLLLVCGGVVWTISGTGKQPEREIRQKNEAAEPDTVAVKEALSYAGDYQAVYAVAQEVMTRQRQMDQEAVYYSNLSDGYVSKSKVSKSGKEELAEGSSGGHSETNVSVEGIAEADQVVTDGEYIYRLREKSEKYYLDIIEADGGTMKSAGKYVCEGEELVPEEFFLAGDQLILLATEGIDVDPCTTQIIFIDIRDRSKPVELGKLTQSGVYHQSRLQDGYLYTVSGGRTMYGGSLVEGREKDDEQDEMIPRINGEKMAAGRIYIPDGCDTTEFTTITSVSLDDSSKFADSRSVMMDFDSGYLHMTEDSIYLTNQKWMELQKKKGLGVFSGKEKKTALTQTQITKFVYHEGKFTGKATKQITGSIRDTFAINEYQGTLRIISSISYNKGKNDNAVYVLDEDLEIIGQIEHLAKDERVYSARFQGEIGYFVTYRETDPLFSVDFSDPHHPKVLGKLKIPGFSEYMHFYNDHLLFGIGVEEKGEEEYVKLSMFDITDPTDVREVHKTLLKKISYSRALYDYKAVLIDPVKNIIGFDGWDIYTDDMQYLVYSYDEEKGFVQKLHTDFLDEDGDAVYRGLYINDTVYLADLFSQTVKAYDLRNGKQIGKYPQKK